MPSLNPGSVPAPLCASWLIFAHSIWCLNSKHLCPDSVAACRLGLAPCGPKNNFYARKILLRSAINSSIDCNNKVAFYHNSEKSGMHGQIG